MTSNPTDETATNSTVESITDLERLRDRPDVQFHEETERVNSELFETLETLDDMAVVGVTNGDGDVLLMRVTEECALKVPTPEVGADEDYAAAARNWVESQAGLEITLDSLVGVWCHEARLEGTERTTTRAFVVFGATPEVDGDGIVETTAEHPEAHAVGWFAELPDDAAVAPGTRRFFD
ncbi:NUDIX domain-containing protein [Natronorubrum sp. DTA28]|uniref:NUDIX domain-containing protein n=1 Tax=Natronorubrum sp. DTA28 TaxID=3447019 RepID=UPI003F87EA7D